jgi:hypothetical protein
MKFTLSDIKNAFVAVGREAGNLFWIGIKVAGTFFLALFLFGAVCYMIGHYFLQCLAILGIFLLGLWFYIELVNARTERIHGDK